MSKKRAIEEEKYNERIAKSTKSLYDKITQYAKTYVIYQGFNKLKKGISETIDEMVEMEQQMVGIDRVLNESGLDIDNYRDKLIQLAHDYGNTFNNVADITLRLAQAGFSSNEAIALTEKTLLALNTAELNATQATDDMVAVMAQWGLMTGNAAEKARNYGEIIDKINKVADNYPTTSADLMDALKKVSSAFNLAGASIDETIATIVAAEKASQRGGKVIGTALSNIVQQIKAEGKLNLAEQLGLDFFEDDAKTKFKPIMEIFQEMADRMEKLKSEGKESSVEMQNLLELFTVFRRNIGASLLGEMSGEDSTYLNVLNDSLTAVGYSIQENEKYMKTAKAAQAQLNAELLKLKTEVWDNGLENVFRSMLMLGNDVVKVLKFLIDNFGTLPTVIGAATLAFTAFNKQIKTQISYDSGFGFKIDNSFFDKIKKAKEDVRALQLTIDGVKISGHEYSETFKQYINNIGDASVSTRGYISYLVKQKAATIAAEAATIALNAAISMGLSVGITALIGVIDKLIHAEENATKKVQERVNQSKDLFNTYEKERESINNLIQEYDELAKKKTRTPEDETKIYEIQVQINSLIKDQKKSIDLVNGAYDETIKKLKEISKEERERSLKQAEITAKETKKQAEEYGNFGLETFRPAFEGIGVDLGELQKQIMPNSVFQASVDKILKNADLETTIRLLEEFKEKMEETDKTSSDMYYKIIEDLKTMYGLQENVNESTSIYNELLAEQKMEELFPEGTIQNAEDYKNALDQINSMDFSGFDGLKEEMISLLSENFPEFANNIKDINDGIQVTNAEISNLTQTTQESIQGLVDLESSFSTVYSAMDEFNKNGAVSASTLQNLINNDLLKYFDVVNGKLSINEAKMADAATAAKAKAIEDLQAQAAAEIAAIAFNTEGNAASVVAGTTSSMSEKTSRVTDALRNMTPEALKAADAWKQLNSAMGGAMNGLDTNQTSQIQTIMNNLSKSIAAVNSVKIQAVSYSRASGGGGSRGATSTSSARTSTSSAEAERAKREAEQAAKEAQKEAEQAAKEAQKAAEEAVKQATKEEEDEYKKRLAAFKDYMSERERLEKRWVDKQKELGQLSTKDYLAITQLRIERYKGYLQEIEKATWLHEEDRLALQKTYTEKIEDLQVDYFGYLKDQLEEEIDALKKANEERINSVKDEADARIAALRKVEVENDRIRTKEEYEKKRKEHLDDISYWEQRTGREAQEALKKAKENLKELDEQWEQQMEDWSIEDQIKAIEEERDAQVKAIEDAQEAEIAAMQAVYDAKVKAFAETGKLIYESSTMQSKALYESYKDNFIIPVKDEIKKINEEAAKALEIKKQEVTKANENLKKVTTTTAAPVTTPKQTVKQEPVVQKQYETYTIQWGDTLTKIARRYGTTIQKIMEANPYVTNPNKIYAGKTLQIPKFHEGGIVGGTKEGFALLKPNEVILKPEWAEGINRLAKMAKQTNTINNTSTVVEVKGDLVKIEASIKNKTDADYLTRRVEKILKDKFNIKK